MKRCHDLHPCGHTDIPKSATNGADYPTIAPLSNTKEHGREQFTLFFMYDYNLLGNWRNKLRHYFAHALVWRLQFHRFCGSIKGVRVIWVKCAHLHRRRVILGLFEVIDRASSYSMESTRSRLAV